MRIGLGHDTHRLGPGGPLLIGGVSIPFEFELIGHSDADVLLHAVTDALLGAIGAGDIGELFPDTDPAHRGQDSQVFLAESARQVAQAGYVVENLDCIVFAQRPKLSEYKQAMEQQIAKVIEIASDRVNVKAKTGESVGPIGRQEAISAECIALLARADSGKPTTD